MTSRQRAAPASEGSASIPPPPVVRAGYAPVTSRVLKPFTRTELAEIIGTT